MDRILADAHLALDIIYLRAQSKIIDALNGLHPDAMGPAQRALYTYEEFQRHWPYWTG
jgi:hypothetical protein